MIQSLALGLIQGLEVVWVLVGGIDSVWWVLNWLAAAVARMVVLAKGTGGQR